MTKNNDAREYIRRGLSHLMLSLPGRNGVWDFVSCFESF